MAKSPDEASSGPGSGTRNARSKFLESVKVATQEKHLELVVDADGPNAGYGYIQKPNGFANYYAFHFEFGSKFAVFYLGVESVEAAGPEQRRQVDNTDGEGLDKVLQEVREKIGEAALEAFPKLSALSKPRETPAGAEAGVAAAAGPKAAKPLARQPSAKADAAVWGHDAKSLQANRYVSRKRPHSNHAGTIAAVVILLLVVFTLAPVLNTNGKITDCRGETCVTYPIYYQSVSFRIARVGGLYVPQSFGWGILGRGTIQAGNGTQMQGVALRQFYLAW